MDKSEISILISGAALFVSFASVLYARRQANAAVAQGKRKKPAFEISVLDKSDWQGWKTIQIMARNLEPVSVRITEIRARPRGAKLMRLDDAMENPYSFNRHPLPTPPAEKAKRTIESNWRIGPVGNISEVPGAGPTTLLLLIAQGVSSGRDLSVNWEWADGEPR